MVKSAWVSLLTVLSLVLVGFAAVGDQASVAASAAGASPAGLVRVIENPDAGHELLVGFELDLHVDDWEETEWGFESELAVAPYGALDGYGVFLFDDQGEPVVTMVSMPSRGIHYLLANSFEREAPMGPRTIGFYEDEPMTYRVVVAFVGAGGVALAPSPDWEETPTAEELLAMPSATPSALGVGTGITVEAYSDITVLGALGAQTTYGTPEVVYGDLVPSHMPGPLLDVEVTTAAPAGWSRMSGIYFGYNAQGTWNVTIEADGTHEFGGLIMQHFAAWPVLLAELLVLGFPTFYGVGGTDGPASVTFDAFATNIDYIESYALDHIALETSLDQLIGVAGPDFSARSYEGLIGLLPLAEYEVRGNDLVTIVGDHETIMLGAAPPGTEALHDA